MAKAISFVVHIKFKSQVYNGLKRQTYMNQSGSNSANHYHVRGTFLGGVLGIIFHIERDLLAFVQGFETFDLNSREMNKNVISTFIVSDETITLLRVKPLYCTLIH